jgi:hypothetical protein
MSRARPWLRSRFRTGRGVPDGGPATGSDRGRATDPAAPDTDSASPTEPSTTSSSLEGFATGHDSAGDHQPTEPLAVPVPPADVPGVGDDPQRLRARDGDDYPEVTERLSDDAFGHDEPMDFPDLSGAAHATHTGTLIVGDDEATSAPRTAAPGAPPIVTDALAVAGGPAEPAADVAGPAATPLPADDDAPPPGTPAAADDPIPTLTDVFRGSRGEHAGVDSTGSPSAEAGTSDTASADTAPSDAPPTDAAPRTVTVPDATAGTRDAPRGRPGDLPPSIAEVDWSSLAQRIREDVVDRLLHRSGTLLDAQLASTLQPVLDRAVGVLALEMQDALNRMIRELVARAVADEVTRVQDEIASRTPSTDLK